MAVLSVVVQLAGLALLAAGFGAWLGWPAFLIVAGLCTALYGMAIEPRFSKEQDDGSGTTD